MKEKIFSNPIRFNFAALSLSNQVFLKMETENLVRKVFVSHKVLIRYISNDRLMRLSWISIIFSRLSENKYGNILHENLLWNLSIPYAWNYKEGRKQFSTIGELK